MSARLQALIELRETLARLVPARGDLQIVVHDSGLDATRIDLDGTPQLRCFHGVWLFFVALGQGKPSPYGCPRG